MAETFLHPQNKEIICCENKENIKNMKKDEMKIKKEERKRT